MKKLLSMFSLALVIAFGTGCEESGTSPSSSSGGCSYNGHSLHVGPKGGCYYINSSGNKTYVDRSECSGC